MDYSARAAKYLTVLGWVSLLSLNPEGLLWLWLAGKLRLRRDGARRGAASLLAAHAAVCLAVIVFAGFFPGRATLRVFGRATRLPPVMVTGAALGAAAVFLLPLCWLTAAGTRQACRSATNGGGPVRCQKCAYDLTGNVSGVCPECGVSVGSPQP